MTHTPEQVAEIAAGLSEAQRGALCSAKGGIANSHWYADDVPSVTLSRLGKLALTVLPTSRLTPLGLAVRAHILKGSDHA